MTTVQIYPDAQRLAQAAAERFVEIAENTIRTHGAFSVALSGGSTPQSLYHILATEPYSERIDWANVQVFWGDERCVPPDHPDSNYLHAKETLLDHVPIPEANIHRIQGELPPEQAADAYEETLLRYFSALKSDEERDNARFDLALLGMGDDGHTASLFPGTAAIHENTRWVTALYVDKLATWRVTLTPAILNRAANIIFLVSGQAKSYTLEKVIYGSYQPDRYPSQVIHPEEGTLAWMIDEGAASLF